MPAIISDWDSLSTLFSGISFLNINLSPSLLPSQPIFERKNGFEHLKGKNFIPSKMIELL